MMRVKGLAKKLETPDGILQVFWISEGPVQMQAPVVRALTNNFPERSG